jgi:hypothetical protein
VPARWSTVSIPNSGGSNRRRPARPWKASGAPEAAHDFDVLQFPGGSWHLMVSDWDAGWIDVDVTDPENPTIVGDFDYAACDQSVPTACPPEGNAYQGEWNSDGSVFVGTDEDFDTYRTSDLTRTTGDVNFPAPEAYATVAVGGAPVTILPDKRLNGPVAYGGYGCPGTSDPIPNADATIPPSSLAPGEEQIIVLQRGPGATGVVPDNPDNPEPACFPGEKVDNATDQGWDAVILTGRHVAGGASADDPPNCGFGAFPTDEQIVAACTTHTAMHELFASTPDFSIPYVGAHEPTIGDVGFEVDITATFDGWGYVRVLDTDPASTPTEIAQISIPETTDENFSTGFGDLTVHEVRSHGATRTKGARMLTTTWWRTSPGTRAGSGSSTSRTRPVPRSSATTLTTRATTSGAWDLRRTRTEIGSC